MMQLRFQTLADEWARGLCTDLSASIKILGFKFTGGEGDVAHFADFKMVKEKLGGLRNRLDATKSVLSSDLTLLSRDHAIGVIVASKCGACASILGSDSAMFVTSAATEDDCTMGYKVFLNNDSVPSLLHHLSRDGIGYKVTEISSVASELHLTTRQLMVLKSAMEMGLYDFPRRITQIELATLMGIKPSTLDEILRRAEKNILGSFLHDSLEIVR